MTLLSSLSRPARSSFSPPRIAMLSPYSRTRVQRGAKFGLGLVLALGRRHEAARNQHHQSADDDAVEQHCEHQIAGDENFGTAKTDRQIAADAPQHAHEGCRGEGRTQDADGEIDRLLRRDADVVRDACLGVLVIALEQVELVIAALGEPARHRVFGEPGAPAPLRTHPRVDHANGDRDASDCQRNENQGLAQDDGAVLFLQRIEDRLVPDVELILKNQLADHERDQRPGHQPRDFPALF